MKRALILALSTALGAALCAAPLAALAADAKASAKVAPYKTPRLAIGQPDLEGYWSNATLTPIARPAAKRSA